MNINIISNYSSLYAGNYVSSMFELAKELSKTNSVSFSFPEDTKDLYWIKFLQEHDFKVCFYNNDSFARLSKSLRKIIESNEIDCVCSNFFTELKIKMSIRKRIRYKVVVHSDFSCGKKESLLGRIKNSLGHLLYQKHTDIVYVSKTLFSQSEYKRKHYLPNAISPFRIINSCEKNTQNNFDKKGINFLCFGWSPFVKGIDVAVESFNKFNSNHNDSQLMIVISRKDNPESYKNRLLRINPNLDFSNVIFLPPISDSGLYFDKCDLFISASRSEGFSYSVLEALINGTKVIVSDIDGTVWAKKYEIVSAFKSGSCMSLLNEMEKCYNSNNFGKHPEIIPHVLKDHNFSEWLDKFKEIMTV